MDISQLLGINPNDSCILCGQICSLTQLEQLGWEEFNNLVHIQNPPYRLVRYYRYNDHSINNLKDGTVYLNDTERFDDCFDCAVDLEYDKFCVQRLKQYCKYFDIEDDGLAIEELPYKIAQKLHENVMARKPIEDMYVGTLDELQKLTIQYFILSVFAKVKKSEDWMLAVVEGIQSEYKEFVNMFNHFKMACFTTSPYLNRMWATNNSEGFCIEYEIDYKNELYASLFPVIYSQKRNDFLPLSLNSDKKPSIDDLWQIYFNGLLRKSFHWADQNEWRLIRYESDKTAKCISFFKIKKVYLGNKMKAPERKEIIAICKDKAIPYVGIIRKPCSFDLIDCDFDCGKCEKIN